MIADWTPLRWPDAWKFADALDLLKGTSINCLIGADSAIAHAAAPLGIQTLAPGRAPQGVTLIEGVWPGIRVARFGSSNAFSAGPTGDPWVNSNIWPVRLAQARKPGTSVWLRANPGNSQYTTAIADAALAGGRWIISLDEALAAAILNRKPEALAVWKSIASTAGYFAAHRAWTDYEPQAVVGIVSAFATSQSQEVLNLIMRSGQQFRAIPLERFESVSLAGLRAIVLPDPDPPAGHIRGALTNFVTQGGLLVAHKAWGAPKSALASDRSHPRFTMLTLGKGTLALARTDLNDPYLLASDTAILVSHRYDLLRFWNGGALSAYYSASPDRKRGLVQILFYANRPADDVTVRVSGPYRTARLSTLDNPAPQPAHCEQQPGALEIHLPGATRYAALELE